MFRICSGILYLGTGRCDLPRFIVGLRLAQGWLRGSLEQGLGVSALMVAWVYSGLAGVVSGVGGFGSLGMFLRWLGCCCVFLGRGRFLFSRPLTLWQSRFTRNNCTGGGGGFQRK